MPKKISRRWKVAGVIVLLLGLLAGLAWWVESRFETFYGTGGAILQTLTRLAASLERGDLEDFGAHLAPDVSGHSLDAWDTVDEKDGIRQLAWRPGETTSGREATRDGWRSYLADFETVDEVAWHIHRLETWGRADEWTATARFELLGTVSSAIVSSAIVSSAEASRPESEVLHVIDRAIFRMTFEAPEGTDAEGSDPTPRLASIELVEGSRIVGPAAQFRDVGPEAGVAFEHQFYPRFLDTPLEFAMLRYGPGGISAADYDDDGFYDLFVPDGVRSRLFRNLGDGTFRDVTAEVGLDGLDGVSVGIFADFDNDGDQDFFVSRTFEPNQLFLQHEEGGRAVFRDATETSGLGADCCTTVASAADYDNDGDLDLYVGRYLDPRRESPPTLYARNGEPNQLYRNRGDATFENVTTEAGVGERGLCLGSVFGDVDSDGDADLYVVNDFGRNTLYRNEGDGTFRDVTVDSGTLAYGAGMNATMGDYDNDLDLDLYVTNIRSDVAWLADRPTVSAYLVNTIVGGHWLHDLPLYWQMYRQSGSDFVAIFQQMAMGNNLLRNDGDGSFRDVSWRTGANPPGWYWGAVLADLDNDGWQDLYAANGWVYGDEDQDYEFDFFRRVIQEQDEFKQGVFFDPASFGGRSWHGHERNRYLRSDGRGAFVEIATAAGNGLLRNSRGVAAADFWNRGALDLAVAASTDRHALLRNEVATGRSWLAVELEGRRSNRDAVGARVEIEASGEKQMREVVLGDGYGSQSSLRLHFGLGENDGVDRLTVRWPASGEVQVFDDVAAGRVLRIVEGESEIVTRTMPR